MSAALFVIINHFFSYMKYCIYLLFFAIFSCNNQQHKISGSGTSVSEAVIVPKDTSTKNSNDICWAGTINGNTPVFLHYKMDSSVMIGEITYLNTAEKLPITLLGTVEHEKSYRLLEFEKSGNITGIITGLPKENTFQGNWFSPKTRKTFALNLQKKDTVVSSHPIGAEVKDIFGKYHYQYTGAGYQGDLEITKLPGSKASFQISSITGEPARNMATVNNDTIDVTTTHFVYQMPNTNDCAFEVRFYNGFAWIRYTNGPCVGEFGNNATVEGLFLKTE